VRLIAACLAVVCLAAPALTQPRPHAEQVRSTTKWGLDLVEEGRKKSPSFRRLLESLRETDVVVYVEPVVQLPGVMEAATELVAAPGPVRYLRIFVAVRAMRKRLIALLGHELQHALEIGRAPHVQDVPTLEEFYRRAGDMSVDGYDSEAARRMAEVILRELWGRLDAPGPRPLHGINTEATVR
jgi:hypothetical protein